MSFPQVDLPSLPPLTIVPNPVEDTENFIQYLNRLYEEIAFAVNTKDYTYFEISITSTAQDIPNLPNFGAFIVCVSGVDSDLPVKTWSLVKADADSAGVVDVIGTQSGTGDWSGFNLTITSTATNFQIRHNNTGETGNFNIRIIGTQ